MKVVLFCGGQGTRMRDSTVARGPKPMAMIGRRPLLWHVMRWYAHYGHTDFVLCLGYGAEDIKDFFLGYRETSSNDFVMTGGGAHVELLAHDIADWRITFLDTGMDASIGQRLTRARPFLADDPVFLANYADVLTNADLDVLVKEREQTDAAALLLAVRPVDSFHTLDLAEDGAVSGLSSVATSNLWVNGGYFVLTQRVFDHLGPDDDLVDGALARLAEQGTLRAHRHEGFWAPADTVKDRLRLEALNDAGVRPWAAWDPAGSGRADRRDGDRRAPARER